MNNSRIYMKTIQFALLRICLGLVGLIVASAITAAGYFITSSMPTDTNAIVTGIAAIVGLIAWWLISHYCGYLLKAGQIAMITKGVADGEVPDNALSAGISAVKERFLTVNVYYAITSAISGITNELTKGINAAAGALGNLTGSDDGKNILGGIGAAISIFVSIILEYVNYCCLGWVFYNKDQNAFKSTCDGAVIYFQNWKTMLANAGKVFAISLVSLVIIGGLLFMAFDAILPPTIITSAQLAMFETDLQPQDVRVILGLVLAFLVWLVVNSALVKPYLLVSVMRKYIDKAKQTEISFDLYEKLSGLSKKFKNVFAKATAK